MNLRHLLALALLPLATAAVLAQETPAPAAQTFTVQNGSKPWYDRDAWTLAQVPASLKSADALPQQNCGSRGLDIPGTPAAITLGVFEKDADAFVARTPAAQKTTDTINVVNTSAVALRYVIFTLAQPPAHIDGAGASAGLILLKVSAK